MSKKSAVPQLPLRCVEVMRELVLSEARQQNIPTSDKKALGELLETFHNDSMESFFPSDELNGAFGKNPTPDLSNKTYEPIAQNLENFVFSGNRLDARTKQKLSRQLRSGVDMIVDVYMQAKLGMQIRGPEAAFAYQKSGGLSKETRDKNKKLVDFNRLKRVGAYAFLVNLVKPFFVPSAEQYENMVLQAAEKLGSKENWNSPHFRSKFVKSIQDFFSGEFRKTKLLPPGKNH